MSTCSSPESSSVCPLATDTATHTEARHDLEGIYGSTWQEVSVPARHPARRNRVNIVGLYLLTVYFLVTIIFLLPRALPGDPLRAFTDEYTSLTPETRTDLEKVHGLDGSLLDQYRRYLGRLARGDLGQSISSSQPVSRLMRTNLPWTLVLTGGALFLSAVISFRVGVTAAWRRGSTRDRALQVVSTAFRAIPEYAVATFLLIALGVVFRIFPISGAYTQFATRDSFDYKVVDAAFHLVLPLTALTVGLLGAKFLLARNITIGVLGQDYMVTARAKGISQQLQKRHHAGRNALLPYLNVVATQVGLAVGGSLFVEEVFGYPGLGRLMVSAVDSRDYPVIQACFLLLSLLVLTANMLIDFASSFVDPRARIS